MDLDNITNDEILYRMVKKSLPDAYIDGKPSAALFMDAGGVSVDRDGKREEQEIVASFKSRFKSDYLAVVKIQAGKCRVIGTFLNPIGNKKNHYHAEIWESEQERLISLLKAMQLADACKEVANS